MRTRRQERGPALVVCLLAGLAGCASAPPGEQPAAPTAAQPAPPDTTGGPIERAPPVQAPAPAPIQRPAAAPPAAAPSSALRVTVDRFEFSGNSAFSAAQLSATVASYLGRPLSLLELYEAADSVAGFYIQNGYTLASVTLPAQKITGGSVRLQVIEGRIGKLGVEGNRRYTAEQMTGYLGSFRSGEIYRGQELQAGLLRLNRLPGLQAKAVLKPGDAFGTSDLLIQATERPVSASLAGDNYGRENLGEYRGSLSGVFNNPLRLEDQFQILYLHSAQGLLDYGYVGYSLPVLGIRGPRASISYGEAQFKLSGALAGVEGENRNARAGLEQNLVRTASDELSASLGVSYTESDADLAGQSLTGGATRITLYELGGSYNHAFESLAVTQVTATISSNFDKSEITDVPRDDQLLRIELDVQHLQPLWRSLDSRFWRSLDSYVHLNAVYSPEPLPDVTQMALGGPSSVRAYPASEVRGDQGTFASAGLRYGFLLGPVTLYLRAFGDTGQVERVDLSDASGLEKNSLASAGAGLDLVTLIGRYNLTAKADWSVALDQHYNDTVQASDPGAKDRAFATISMGF